MRFTVLWTPDAEKDLADIWIEAPDRRAISTAANAIDASLAERPESFGESRDQNVRVAFMWPLGIEFEVLSEDRIVYVLSVWSFR